MILALLIAFLFSFCLGHAVLALFWRPVMRPVPDFLFRSLFALGLGPALSGMVFLAWVTCTGSHRGWIGIELAIIAALSIFAWRRKRKVAAAPDDILFELTRPTLLQAALGLIFVAAIAAAFHTSWHYAAQYPHGSWDAWAIWNQKARFMYRAPEHWRDVLQIHYSHPDYPLLLPSLIARTWSVLGQDTTVVPLLIGQGYLFGIVLLMTAGVGIIRGAAQGLIAGSLLLGAQTFLYTSASQYSDIPFAFYMLCSCVALGLHDRFERQRPQFLYLSGIMAALAAWTKNEGVVLAVTLLLAWLVSVWWTHGVAAWRADTPRLAAFVLAALILIVLFKAQAPVQNKLLAGAVSDAGRSKLLDPERHRYVLAAVGEMLPRQFFWLRGKYAWQFPAGLLLVAYALLLGISREVRAARNAVLLIFLGQALAYHLAFVATPYDLEWHVNTALERLIQQLWPLFIFTYFLWVRAPEAKPAPSAPGL